MGSNILIPTYFKSIVSPWSKLEVTTLIIKWEPRDVYLTRAFKYTRWHVQHWAIRWGHNICLECSVKPFICAGTQLYITLDCIFIEIVLCRVLRNSMTTKCDDYLDISFISRTHLLYTIIIYSLNHLLHFFSHQNTVLDATRYLLSTQTRSSRQKCW